MIRTPASLVASPHDESDALADIAIWPTPIELHRALSRRPSVVDAHDGPHSGNLIAACRHAPEDRLPAIWSAIATMTDDNRVTAAVATLTARGARPSPVGVVGGVAIPCIPLATISGTMGTASLLLDHVRPDEVPMDEIPAHPWLPTMRVMPQRPRPGDDPRLRILAAIWITDDVPDHHVDPGPHGPWLADLAAVHAHAPWALRLMAALSAGPHP